MTIMPSSSSLTFSMALVMLRSVVTVSEAAAAGGLSRSQPFRSRSSRIDAGSTRPPAMFVTSYYGSGSHNGGGGGVAGRRRRFVPPVVVVAPPRPRHLGHIMAISGYGRPRWRGDAGWMTTRMTTRYGTGGRSNIHENDDDQCHDDDYNDPTSSSRNCRPFEWEELQEIITTPPCDRPQRLAELYRSPKVQEAYQNHRTEILQDYESLMDYILVSKLKQDRQRNVTTQKWKVVAVPTTTTAGPVLALRRNDFPYCVAHPIEHWVLWKWWGGDPYGDDEASSSSSSSNTSLIRITDEEIQQAVTPLLCSSSSFEKDVLYWENPPHLQSLPEIRHVHILIRGPTREEQAND